MKSLLVAVMIILFGCELNSQERSIFLEIGGSGGLGSVNYEKAFWHIGANKKHNQMELPPKHKWWTSYRIGLGLSPIDRNNGWVIVFPVMFNFQYGLKAHKLELGTGLSNSVTTKGAWFIKSPVVLGYRYQPVDRKIFFRISYTPIVAWLVDFQWQHWAGVSIGYRFAHE